MRWYGQLAVIAVLGAAGYGGWHAYRTGQLASVPGLGQLLPRAGDPQAHRQPAQRQGPPPVVEVDAVRTGRIVETREAVGTVRAHESIIVTAKVSGIIQEISFQEGEKVESGDVLVRLYDAERRADIEAAVAESHRAAAQRDEVRTRLDRAQALRRSGAGTEAQVEDLAAQMRTLESAIASAEARRRAAEARLEDLVVRAPFAGRLGTRSVSVGAYVSPGTRITTLDDLSRIRLDFSVPENLLARLQPGQAVRATSAAFGERVFHGTVAVIDPRVDPATRTVRLTAEFANPDEALRPGMFLSVLLEVTNKDDATVVPEEAIVSEGLRQLLYVVKDRTVERRVVRLGQRQAGRVEVIEGVSPGETIVVRGVQRVRPGLTVDPKPVGGEAPTGTRGAESRSLGPALPQASQPSAGSAGPVERRG